MGVANRLSSSLENRFGGHLVARFLQQKSVPVERGMARHFLGGAVLFFFLVQVATGILLSMYYVPTVENAFAGMEQLVREVDYGWLVRSIHKWSADLMVTTLFLHFLSTFLCRAYRRPREFTWITGCLLFGIVLSICFFGYLLPWTDLSFFATRAGVDIMGSVPVFGGMLTAIVQGGESFNPFTLSRFYFFHVSLLPGLLAVILIVHFYLIQVHGISRTKPASDKAASDDRIAFFPDFTTRILVFWVVLLNLLFVLCFVFPAPLGYPANPFESTPSHMKPEWYFLFLYQFLKLAPSRILTVPGEQVVLVAASIAGVFTLAFPFLDRHDAPTRTGYIARVIMGALLLTVVSMSIWGHLS